MNVRDQPLYGTWRSMIARCKNPNVHNFHNYGGRGISVCARWRTFANFVSDMGDKPSPDHTLDRINSDGDYEPANCHWATRLHQARNQRRTVTVVIDGIVYTAAGLAETCSVHPTTIKTRIRKGMRTLAQLTAPAHSMQQAARLGTSLKMQERLHRIRTRTHCKRGHEFTPDNIYTDPHGTRVCRECLRISQRKSRAAARGLLQPPRVSA